MIRKIFQKILFEERDRCINCSEKGAGPDGLCPSCHSLLDKTSSRHILSEDPFLVSYSAGFYNNFLKESFAGYKFRGKSYWGPVFSQMIEDYLHNHPLLSKAQWISYIPMRRLRETKRGLNPSKEMAGFVAQKEGIILLNSLNKVRETREQNKLSGRERKKNIEGVFEVNLKRGRIPGRIWNKEKQIWMTGAVPLERLSGTRGILLDDFLTTGNTMREGLLTLLDSGIPALGLTLASVSYPKENEREVKGLENGISRTINDFQRTD